MSDYFQSGSDHHGHKPTTRSKSKTEEWGILWCIGGVILLIALLDAIGF